MDNRIGPQDSSNWSNAFQWPVLTQGQIPNFETIMTQAKIVGDKIVWALIPSNEEPHPNLMCRNLFTYALLLCETETNTNTRQRLNTVLHLADQMQIKTGDQKGQFYKHWADKTSNKPVIIDPNMAEFCMRGAAILLKKHHHVLPTSLKVLVRGMMETSVGAIEASKVPPEYTNVSLLNALNLMLLGDILDLPAIVSEGQNRFDRFCMYTKNWGIHEYCSATYTGIQVSVLGLIERFVPERSSVAKSLLELYWVYIATNWLQKLTRFGGTNSRQIMSYLHEDGGMNGVMKVMGWPGTENETVAFIDVYPALAQCYPSDALKQAVEEGFPHQIRHSWGVTNDRARTHYVCKDITLSVSGASYDMWVGSQIPPKTPQFYTPKGCYEVCEDMAFTVDFTNYSLKLKPTNELISAPISSLSSPSLSVPSPYPGRCYFVPDDNDNPYGDNQYNNTHLCPLLWTAAQHERDALGLVLYSLDNRENAESPLKSHFVMPYGVTEFWMGGTSFDPREQNHDILLNPEDALVLVMADVGANDSELQSNSSQPGRFAAVGFKVLWSQGLTGKPAQVHFHADGEKSVKFDAVRLTVDHVDPKDPTLATSVAGALFLVRIANNLTWDGFQNWQKKFNKASADVLKVKNKTAEGIESIRHFEAAVRGVNGDRISINAVSPDGGKFMTSVEPPFCQSALEINGADIGKVCMNQMPFIQEFENTLQNDSTNQVTQIPGYWEAEDGRMYPPMVVGKDQKASEGGYVWMNPASLDTWEPGSAVGSVTWRLQIPQESTYYIWGQLIAPQQEAFLVRIYDEPNMNFPFYVSPWATCTSSDWTWSPMILSPFLETEQPTPLVLPQGEVRLELFPQVACGAKIDRLFITTDLKAIPK